MDGEQVDVQYEVPREQLESAFDEDTPLQNLLEMQQESEESWEKKQKEREDTIVRLKEELVVEAKESRKLAGAVRVKRNRVKILSKRKTPPSLANLKRRIVRRKATIRDTLLRQFLSTKKEDFLLRWKEAHGENENEVSKET